VVLALLVKNLPPHLRGRALRYGIIGAYVFRIAALALATWVMTKWYLKALGGAYLLYLAWAHFSRHQDEQPSEKVVKRIFGLSAFWSTVIAVEMTDIVFSVDSIAAAVALSDKLWVLILGGLFGILAMRFAAQGFVRLLEVFPRLESAAFIAVAVIGLKLLSEFPADVVGFRHRFPEGTTYATSVEYSAMVHRHATPVVHINHVLTINKAAAPQPDRAVMDRVYRARLPEAQRDSPLVKEQVNKEFARAESAWTLHYRPFIEVEGWITSLLVLLIFTGGFLKRGDEKTTRQDGT
jgi:YkoY family integral membrane protein